MPGPYDLILFDWDGTLVHSMPSIEHATRRTFEEAGLPPISTEHLHQALRDGKGLEFFLKILHPTLSDTEVDELKQQWRAMYEAEAHPYTSPFPGTPVQLARLAEAGIPLAVFSNKGEPALLRSVKEHGLDGFFRLLVGDLPGLPKKPHPEAFFERVQPHFPGLDPTRVLMVGDAESYLRFGRSFGATTCFAAYGYGDLELCRAEKPDLTIDSIHKLASTIFA